MEYKNIENLIIELSKDPFNPEINFKCAVEYEKLNQTASAVSFYLRCAEYGYEDVEANEYVYASLHYIHRQSFHLQHDSILSVILPHLLILHSFGGPPEVIYWRKLYMNTVLILKLFIFLSVVFIQQLKNYCKY